LNDDGMVVGIDHSHHLLLNGSIFGQKKPGARPGSYSVAKV
jgi:hypothetical protein